MARISIRVYSSGKSRKDGSNYAEYILQRKWKTHRWGLSFPWTLKVLRNRKASDWYMELAYQSLTKENQSKLT